MLHGVEIAKDDLMWILLYIPTRVLQNLREHAQSADHAAKHLFVAGYLVSVVFIR